MSSPPRSEDGLLLELTGVRWDNDYETGRAKRALRWTVVNSDTITLPWLSEFLDSYSQEENGSWRDYRNRTIKPEFDSETTETFMSEFEEAYEAQPWKDL